ncbi:hypothetical protein [Burkholderia plantarii]|uniref:hypothetical protein n=1 Tax=Burkholderia plantarii TaxID=41899 RepID=UPI001ABAD06C|nr:hypothetical protein [Burkholderia plantarii]
MMGRRCRAGDDVVYAELTIGYARIESLDAFVAFVAGARLRIDPMPRAALFLAGRCPGAIGTRAARTRAC